MTARIFRPARSAMQSGKRNTRLWRLVYEPEVARTVEPLMGWTSSSDMKSQIKMSFDTKDEAIAYAEKHGIPYRIEAEVPTRHQTLSYADNFKYDRTGPWTH